MARLYITIGIPGAGKSTYTKTLNAKVISSDAIRGELFGDEGCQDNPKKVFAILNSRVRKSLLDGEDVIYDATNVTKKARRTIINTYKNIADEIIACYFDTPVEVAKIRNANRTRVVPDEIIDNMYKKLTVPEFEEGFSEIIYIKTSNDGQTTITSKINDAL